MTKHKKSKKEFIFCKNNTPDDADDLEQWLFNDSDCEISDKDLINNPFNFTKCIKVNGQHISTVGLDKKQKAMLKEIPVGCPFNLFYMSILDIENILDILFTPKEYRGNKREDRMCKYEKFYILTDDDRISYPTSARYSAEDLEMAKIKARKQSQYEFPIFTGLFGLLPCQWEYIKNKDGVFVQYRLRILSSAKNGNTLTKLIKKDFIDWKKIVDTYCLGNIDYDYRDLRKEFSVRCLNRNEIRNCKDVILANVYRCLNE